MKNNSYVWWIVAVVVIVGGLIWWLYPSQSNTWVCENGQWVAQGNPTEPMPTSSCTNVQQATSSLNAGLQQNVATLVFQPKQCTTQSWQTWFNAGNFKNASTTNPSEEDIIKAYYSQMYGINIISAKRTDTVKATCTTCNVCSKAYVYSIEVSPADVEKLVSLGWTDVSMKQ